MKSENIKHISIALGIYVALSVVFSILLSWLWVFIESSLFGDFGAQSYDERTTVLNHNLYVITDVVFELLKIILPCSYIAYKKPNFEIRYVVLISTFAALFITVTRFSWFPYHVLVTFLFTALLFSIISIPLGLVFRFINRRREST